MIYVMSDIHGQRRRFDSVLQQINFQPEDTLYILGDVIDRNPDGIKILRQIMATPNMKMLMGNHELMMLDALYFPAPKEGKWAKYHYEHMQSRWYNNGGKVTHDSLKHLRKTTRAEIFDYLDKLPINYELAVNGKQFILAHAAPVELFPNFSYKYDDERFFAVWKRFENFPIIEGKTVIFGHTPTCQYNFENPLVIWNADSWIGIDCGCMFPEDGDPWSGLHGRLACLRLDDMQEYYSYEPRLEAE